MQMITYCLSFKKDAKNIDPEVVKTKNNRLMMLSKCSVCNNKMFRFIKEQQAKGLLNNFVIRTPLSQISLLNVLF